MNFKPNYIIIPAILFALVGISLYFGEEQLMLGGPFFLFWITPLLIALWRAIPIILFWNNFPRREAHFYPILGLFVIAILLNSLNPLFASLQLSETTIMIISFLPLIVDILLIAGLWTHGLRTAAYWIVSYLLFELLILLGALFAIPRILRPEPVRRIEMERRRQRSMES
jgi:hypothetical protein